jgi:hypothetical protein
MPTIVDAFVASLLEESHRGWAGDVPSVMQDLGRVYIQFRDRILRVRFTSAAPQGHVPERPRAGNLPVDPGEFDAGRHTNSQFIVAFASIGRWWFFSHEWFASFFEPVAAAPPIPGHEQLLIDLGLHPLHARIVAYAVQKLGRRWAAECNETRRQLALIRPLARMSSATALVISRRAQKLRLLLDDGVAKSSLELAVEQSNLQLTLNEIMEIMRLAENRNPAACRHLVSIAQKLLTSLPDSRGRSISEQTGVHRSFLWFLGLLGHATGHTWSSRLDDFSDRLTLATRLAVGNPHFNPRYARELHKRRTK